MLRLSACIVAFILSLACSPPESSTPASGRNPSLYAPAPPGKRMMDPMALGKRTYNNCVVCHQTTGKGLARRYPPLDGSAIASGPPAIPALIVLHGLKGPLTIDGQTYNEEMVPWGGTLTDEQIAAVLTYVRASWSNRAGPVDAGLVGQLRRRFAGRSTSWTIDELNALELDGITSGAMPQRADQ